MKILISHPTSNQFNRSALSAILEKQMLGEFHTSVACFPGSILSTVAACSPFSQIGRRSFTRDLEPLTKSFPFLEFGRIGASKLGLSSLLKHEKGFFCLDAVYREVDHRVSSHLKRASARGVNGIYAYEDGALSSFLKAKTLDMSCFYDLPIGYWRAARKILNKEKDRWPDWAATLTGLMDSEAKLKRKDKELALADRIFVASSFTAKTLDLYPGTLAPVEVIPYGFPKPVAKRDYIGLHQKRPLKLLFVGGLSQRKGIADVFAVADKFGSNVSLTVVGYKASNNCPALDQNLKKHTWFPSLPHHKILELMRTHDILVFPSLFEGFGMVITEAMSQGTPVITTDRTAGPDIIKDGENGWLIEAGSTIALEQCIDKILLSPKMIMTTGKLAREAAVKRPWEVYGYELANSIERHRKELKNA